MAPFRSLLLYEPFESWSKLIQTFLTFHMCSWESAELLPGCHWHNLIVYLLQRWLVQVPQSTGTTSHLGQILNVETSGEFFRWIHDFSTYFLRLDFGVKKSFDLDRNKSRHSQIHSFFWAFCFFLWRVCFLLGWFFCLPAWQCPKGVFLSNQM